MFAAKIREERTTAMKTAAKILAGLSAAAVSLSAILFAAAAHYSFNLPDEYYVTGENVLNFSNKPFTADLIKPVSTEVSGISKNTPEQVQLRLFGVVPIKNVSVMHVDEPVLVPCGTPFGIKLLTDGVMVIDTGEFTSERELVSPARSAGLQAGDIITSVNGQKVMTNAELQKLIAGSGGKPVTVSYRRNSIDCTSYITPKKSSEDGKYKAGLWVRDSTAGIGTVTFYNAETGVFAGLGHPVCDSDNGEILPLSTGQSADVIINGVSKGKSGKPGELLGTFTTGLPSGILAENCQSGVYGLMDSSPVNSSGIPLAMRQEIEIGDAYILSTIKGKTPKQYSVSIEKIDLTDAPDSRNMVIRITDPQLLSETGGIVQGMSGSPIIQNGKLVGAVTHVFVSNPKKGYAIFADTMYEESCKISVSNENAA